MNGLISVIIPVYNVENYLKNCVNSVTTQTYSNIEILLIDDGSTDKSGSICDEFLLKDSRIRVVHRPNGGVSSARNCGIDLSKGEFVFFVDADDWIESNMVEKMFINIGNADIAFCGYTSVYRNTSISALDKPPISGIVSKSDFSPYFDYFFTHGVLFPPFCKLYRKQLIGSLRFDENIWLGEDQIFNSEYYTRCKSLCIITESLYYYNCFNSESAMHKPPRFDRYYYLRNVYLAQKKMQSALTVSSFKTDVVDQSFFIESSYFFFSLFEMYGFRQAKPYVKQFLCDKTFNDVCVILSDYSIRFKLLILFSKIKNVEMVYLLWRLKRLHPRQHE